MQFPDSDNVILRAWQDILALRSDDAAVLNPGGEVCRTFREIEEESRRLTGEIEDFEAGSVVALQVGNSEIWPALLIALFRHRLIPMPLGRHVEKAELEAVIETVGVTVVATVDSDGLSLSRTGRCLPKWNGHVPEFLKLTSGTTSAPRAVRFRAPQLLADCDNICRTMGIGPGDLNFGVVPFSHSYGFSNLITPLICRGVSLVASDDRIPRAILNGLAATGATVFAGMPIFFDKLASLENIPALPRLRLCISAGAPLSSAVAGRFTEKFGLKVHTFYGSSECGGIGYDRSPEIEYRDGYAGSPMDGVVIESSRTEQPATITVQGEAVGDGYFPDEADSPLGAGRFVPGDMIRWTDTGMWIAGRVSDVINVAGRKLNPGEVECRLERHPKVRQAIVFGIASALRGEEPVLCVAGQGIDREELLRYCRSNLSEWQMPRDIWIVDEIPMNERGKVSRRQLAEKFLSLQS